MSLSTVRDVIRSKSNSRLWTISPEHLVFDAIQTMSLQNIGALIVLEGEKIVGIVTERDYARKVVLENRSSRETTVEKIMNTQVIFVEPNEIVNSVMKTMTESRVRHIPVVDQGKLVGIISIGDIVKAMLSDKDFLIHQLTTYITGTPVEPILPAGTAIERRIVG